MIENVHTEALPRLLTTAIGSLPHLEAGSAVELILKSLSVAPHLPQLSRLDPREQMWIQFSEGLPGFKADLDKLKYYFQTSEEHSILVEKFYEDYIKLKNDICQTFLAPIISYISGRHIFWTRIFLHRHEQWLVFHEGKSSSGIL